MTRKHTRFPMELDLDAFLPSHPTATATDSDSDDDDDHRRTVDEILLNDSDSTPSPSSYPQRLSTPDHSQPTLLDDDVLSEVRRPKTLALGHAPQITDTSRIPNSRSIESKLSLASRLKSGEYSSDSILSSGPHVLPSLPPLFGGARPNAKPGAALAAAAAASRSIPTPHAAAIKSRRASAATLQKALENVELGSKASVADDAEVVLVSGAEFERLGVSNGDSSAAGSDISQQDGKLVEEDCNWDTFLSAVVESDGVSIKGTQTEGSPVSRVGESKIDCVEQLSSSSNLEPHVTSISAEEGQNLDDGNHKDVQSSSADENDEVSSVVMAASELVDKGSPSSQGSDESRKVEADVALAETYNLENLKAVSLAGEASLAGEDSSALNDGTELLEDINFEWENERIGNKRAGRKTRISRKPLELAEELEKKHSSTGLHWEEGAAAQPMRLEGVRRGSTVLGYFDVDANNSITRTISSQAFRRDHGSPQVVAANLNYIALGMSKGVVVVMPSKYSPHHADSMNAKMLMLGLQGERSHTPVTSMCFNQQGDLLFAGYGDGHYTVWDVQKASVVKVISEHKAPVVHMLYMGQDSQGTRQFNVISGDSKGVIKLIGFTSHSWLNRFSTAKPLTLLDESTSTVICASPLVFDESSGGSLMPTRGSLPVSTSGIGSMMGGVVGGDWKLFEGSPLVEEGVVVFVTHQSALVAKVNPTVEVYATLPKPEGVREGSMPYAAWKCMGQPHGSPNENVHQQVSEKVPLLAIAWDRKVQVAKLVKSELKVYGKWSLDSSAVGVAWLNDQMLVVLMSTGQLYLFAKDGTAIHQTSFVVDGSRGDDLIAYHTHFTNIFGNPEKAYHNCVAVRGATIYILGPTHLVVSRLLPWKERIEVLRKAGDWMGALNMAMTLYDGQAHGVIDLPRSLDDVQKAIMPYLVELLLSYVDEVFSYISVAFCNLEKMGQLDDSKSQSGSAYSEIKEQYTRVGGVAVEFCVHIKRNDILFDEILSRFVSAEHKETFLELLEPYILKDMLGSLPPEVMQALVEHYSMKGWLQRVEQCVLHMDISSLDFNQVVRLCREHRLYGALIYLFNKGLDDFRAPLEELLVVLRNSERESAAGLGYRVLVYLKYCFSGLSFPPGHGKIPPTRLPSLRTELLQFLLEESNAPNSADITSLSSIRVYPNLYHLLELDTEAALDVLRCAFVEDELPNSGSPLRESANSIADSLNVVVKAMKEDDLMVEDENLVQKIVDSLSVILDTSFIRADRSTSSVDAKSEAIWPSKDGIGHVIEFIGYYVSCERANVTKVILSQILEYLTSEISIPSVSGKGAETSKRRERQMLALLEVVPETDWEASYLLHLCEKAQFYQVCGFIHSTRHQYVAALDSYMKDVDEPIHAFSFIDHTLRQPSNSERDAFQSAVISRIPDLVKLCREATFFLVLDHFNGESQHILSELHSHPESLFLYLKTVVEVHSSGTLSFSSLRKIDTLDVLGGRSARDKFDRIEAYLKRISDFPKFLRNHSVDVTDEMIELFLELLCRYERSSVLKFLETFESYRVERCLRLCQEYGIIDAAAFLLERVGIVGNALSLTLSGLNDKFIMLDAAVGALVSDNGVEPLNTVLKNKEVNDILDIVHACIGLCQRNSPRLDPEESEFLWFQLLDSFCEPLMESCDAKRSSVVENQMGTLVESLGSQDDGEVCKITWKLTKSHNGAHILRKLFSMFIKKIVEGMIGYVRLPTIMLKLLSDNGSQEFGDFKLTILEMLGTYDFERRILDTAKSLIEDDTFYTMSLLKKGASHGFSPRSLLCCICSCLLSKTSSGSTIRVFNCGHAIHLQCELQEKEASRSGSSAGCPICMPKKRAQRSKNKSVLAENGLVSKSLTKHQLSHGNMALPPYENDTFDSSYSSISRFDILTNLQKDHKLIQVENMPQLRLAPPAVYHEKVKKGVSMLTGDSSSGSAKVEKTNKSRQLRELKVKGSSLRFPPLKSNIFGKEKKNKR